MSIIGPTSFSFNGIDWKKLGIGAVAVAAGALLTYISSFISGQNFGLYAPIVTAVWTVVASVAGKWVSDNE